MDGKIDFDKVDMTLMEAIAVCDLLSVMGEDSAKDTIPTVGLLLTEMLCNVKKELEK